MAVNKPASGQRRGRGGGQAVRSCSSALVMPTTRQSCLRQSCLRLVRAVRLLPKPASSASGGGLTAEGKRAHSGSAMLHVTPGVNGMLCKLAGEDGGKHDNIMSPRNDKAQLR